MLSERKEFMKNLLSKKIPIAFASVAICATPLALSSCSTSDAIQLANFESYMNDDLMDYLASKYGVEFQWFTVAEMIETKFEQVYDIAVPSAYELVALYKRGWLEKIDWSKFNMHDPLTDDLIDTTEEVEQLIAEPVRDAIHNMNDGFRHYLTDDSFNILDYGVPYFLQSFMFVYKGSELTFYKNGTTQETQQPTWSDIFYTISPSNPKLDPRFNQTVTGRTGMLDDAKTLYDISRIMQTTTSDPFTATNEMPKGSTIPDLVKTFDCLADKFKDKQGSWFALNTDSGIISRNLADHAHGYEAALTWSGDALYGALGAEEFEPYSSNEMHIQRPYGTSLDEIEFLVINKKNHNDSARLDRIYKTIFDICLDGALAEPTKEGIGAQEGDRFKYWSMQNWDTVNYTPIWKSIYDYAVNTESEYWDYVFEGRSMSDEEKLAAKQLYVSIVSSVDQDYAHSVFGRTLEPVENSNTHWAWLQTRGKL